MSYVIGLDIGTSGMKIAAMDEEGKLHFLSYASYQLKYPAPEQMEIDPEEIWRNVIALIRKTVDCVKEVRGRITAISFSTFCNASILMDKDGNHLGHGILYMDQRSQPQAQHMREVIGEDRFFCISGNRLEAGMISSTTLLWSLENVNAKPYKWGHLPTFIIAKLTGEFVLDWTQASYTGIFDIRKYEWSIPLCEELGIPTEILPRVVGSGEVVGEIRPSLHDLLGISQIPVVAGAADTACSTFALGAKPGELFESVGTSNVITVVKDQADRVDHRFLNRCHVVKGQWLSHGAMSTPGLAIRWFYQEFLQQEGPLDQVFVDFPLQSPVGSNGVFFLPYMFGERSPIWDPHARGMFIGISLTTHKQDMARAILEGCAYGLRELIEIVQSEYGLDPSRIHSIGGGSKNSTWCQIKANVLDKVIQTRDIKETAVLGACKLAALAIGNREVRQPQLSTSAQYVPDPRAVEQYAHFYPLFKTLYPSVKTFYYQASQVKRKN